MKRLLLFYSLLLLSTFGYAEIVTWHASSGFLPSDNLIPFDQRMEINEETPSVILMDGYVKVIDNEVYPKNTIYKGYSSYGDEWVVKVEIRMNSHQRTTIDWGAWFGFPTEGKLAAVLISSDRIGFAGSNWDSYLLNSYYEMDTTKNFHSYMLVKTSESLNLFIDGSTEPVLSIGTNLLADNYENNDRVVALQTTRGGISNCDIKSIAFNTNGIIIPEPSTLLLFFVSLSMTLRRDR